jgi:hypothetical protein
MGMATTTKAETVQFAAIIKWAIVESGLMATAIECRRNMCKWRKAPERQNLVARMARHPGFAVGPAQFVTRSSWIRDR